MRTLQYLFFIGFVVASTSFDAIAQWSADPQTNTAVCTASGNQTYVQCVSDGDGGAIFSWNDSRNGGGVYAQRVDASGVARWVNNGVEVTSFVLMANESRIVTDGRGGAIITYVSGALKAQRIDSSGVVRWGTDGVAMIASLLSPDIVRSVSAADHAGGVVAALYQRDGATWNNYVAFQRADSSGMRVGSELGITIASGTASNPVYSDIDITCDVQRNAVVAWTSVAQTRAQRVLPNGDFAWGTAGTVVCNAGGAQWNPRIVSDDTGSLMAVWVDGRNAAPQLYAVRIDTGGSPHAGWPANGLPICDTVVAYESPAIDEDGAGGAFVAFNVPQAKTYVQRISSIGTLPWGARGVLVSTSTTMNARLAIMNDGAGGAVVAWQDRRRGSTDNIYAQRINASGTRVWPDSGVLICSAANQQSSISMTMTTGSGAILGWQDERGATESDVYAQRVFANGVLPVQLISFTGSIRNGEVHLQWRTASELNNYGFEVQKSQSASDGFRTIPNSFIAGHGTTNQQHSYSYVDRTATTGMWYYRLKQVDLDGAVHFSEPIMVSSLTSVKESGPLEFSLRQNFPNPFNPETTITFSVEKTDRATLDVCNLLGQRVATLFDDVAEAGNFHTVKFNASHLASGLYFSRLRSGGRCEVKKLLLTK